MEPNRYIFISSADASSRTAFPCTRKELKSVLDYYTDDELSLLEEWPGNSHGPTFPLDKYSGTIILDIKGQDPTHPMSAKEVLEIKNKD